MDLPKLFNALICEIGQEHREKSVPFFIDCVDNNKRLSLYNVKDLKPLITFINTSLNDSNSRIDALNVLNVTIEQCSTETFSEHHLQWVHGLKKVVTTDKSIEIRILSADILNRIFTYASVFPEFVRNLATQVVPQFLQSVTATLTNDEYSLSGVKLVGSFLKFFPGSCRSHINVVKKKILILLVSDNREVVELSALTLAMIPYVGTSGGAKTDLEANWMKFYDQLLNSVHHDLNVLYDKVEMQDKKEVTGERLQFEYKETDGDPVLVQLSLCRRTIGVLVTIRKILTTEGRDSKLFLTVPIEDTLSLACRILNVNSYVKIDSVLRNQPQIFVLLSFIPILHDETVKVLIDLVLTCRRHMSLHGTPILQIIQQCLIWTSQNNEVSEYGHPLTNLRVSAYKLFVTWLETVHSPGGLKNFELSLVNQMLSDVIPKTQSVIIDPGSLKAKSGRSNSKKAKRNFGSISSIDVIHCKNHLWANSELCEAALKALKALFYLGAEDLRLRSLNMVHDAILKLSFDIQTLVNVQHPYKDPKCRTAVYKLLLATIVPQHPQYVPQLSASIEILSKGVMDVNSGVSEACIEALAVCQMMINPRRRPMNYLTSVQATDDDSDVEHDEEDPTVAMEEEEVKSTVVNGFGKDNEDVIVNGQAEVTEDVKEDEITDAILDDQAEASEDVEQDAAADHDGNDDDDDVQLLECPLPDDNDDCALDETQLINSTMDVDSDSSDEPEIIGDLKPIATVGEIVASKETPVEMSPPTDSEESKGAEEMLITFVDTQSDVN